MTSLSDSTRDFRAVKWVVVAILNHHQTCLSIQKVRRATGMMHDANISARADFRASRGKMAWAQFYAPLPIAG
ncbi:MAG: hypothetical protein IT488_12775 [Gammaproteobacteria bacterium]|nr:hypothetical protein [Gammaproteobacteria bacterium]